jgi:hypothetical protein
MARYCELVPLEVVHAPRPAGEDEQIGTTPGDTDVQGDVVHEDGS